MNTIQSKTTTGIVRKTLVYETENHIFKVPNVNATDDKRSKTRVRGVIEHKDGTKCGDFSASFVGRKQLTVNLDLDCKFLLVDLIDFLNAFENQEIVEVEQFAHEAVETETTTE